MLKWRPSCGIYAVCYPEISFKKHIGATFITHRRNPHHTSAQPSSHIGATLITHRRNPHHTSAQPSSHIGATLITHRRNPHHTSAQPSYYFSATRLIFSGTLIGYILLLPPVVVKCSQSEYQRILCWASLMKASSFSEDVISDRVSHYWSPDGKYICYARLDDNGVPLQAWPWYGAKSNVFGDTIEIAYPKVTNT